MLRFKGRILCGLSVGGQIIDTPTAGSGGILDSPLCNSEADESVPRAVASEVPSISPFRKLRSLPLAVLTRRSGTSIAQARTLLATARGAESEIVRTGRKFFRAECNSREILSPRLSLYIETWSLGRNHR